MAMARFTRLLLSLCLAVVVVAAWGEDVRPDGTQAEDATDCTTSNAHTRMDNDVTDAWNGGDDCDMGSAPCNTSTDFDFVSNITFGTPSASPVVTAGAQVFAMRARKCSTLQSGTPAVRMDAYCNGTLVQTGTDQNVSWNGGEGDVVTQAWTFNTTDCASDGSDVEILVHCNAAGGSPSARVRCAFDAIEWRANIQAASPTQVIAW